MKKAKDKSPKRPKLLRGELNLEMPDTGTRIHVVYEVGIKYVVIGWQANGIPQGKFGKAVRRFVNREIIAAESRNLTGFEVQLLLELWVDKP